MKDNKGFSLVELVIVMALMAVLGTFVFIGFGLLTGQYARECANDISAALGKEKNYSLTRSATIDCYMELMYDSSDGYHVKYYQPKDAIATGSASSDWVLANEEKVGSRRVCVNCEFDDGTSTVIQTGQSVKFIYDRISGALKISVKSDGSGQGLDVAQINSDLESSTAVNCTKITIDYGRTYEINLYPATGKHELARIN